jgi:hypothetical protein
MASQPGTLIMKNRHILIWATLLTVYLLSRAQQTSTRAFFPIASKPQTHFYAQAEKIIGTFYGVQAIITTANPMIRQSYFSYATINISDPNGNWVETGLTKSSTSGCIPKFTWAISPDGYANFINSVIPQIGSQYQFTIYQALSGVWKLIILNSSGVLLIDQTIDNPNMTYGSRLQAAGEVDSVNRINDMGIADILSLQWKDNLGYWQDWNGWMPGVINNPYLIQGTSPDINNNVKISGNNGNPNLPASPCP